MSIQLNAHRLRYIKSIGLVSPDVQRRENNIFQDQQYNCQESDNWDSRTRSRKIYHERKNAAIADASSSLEGNTIVSHISSSPPGRSIEGILCVTNTVKGLFIARPRGLSNPRARKTERTRQRPVTGEWVWIMRSINLNSWTLVLQCSTTQERVNLYSIYEIIVRCTI